MCLSNFIIFEDRLPLLRCSKQKYNRKLKYETIKNFDDYVSVCTKTTFQPQLHLTSCQTHITHGPPSYPSNFSLRTPLQSGVSTIKGASQQIATAYETQKPLFGYNAHKTTSRFETGKQQYHYSV